jgi:hypothetical protein
MKKTIRDNLNCIYQYYSAIHMDIYEQIQQLCKKSNEQISNFIISTELGTSGSMILTVNIIIRNVSCEDIPNLLTMGAVLVLTTDPRVCDVRLTVNKIYRNIKEV